MQTLFDPPIPCVDPNLPAEERPRLSKQAAQILAMLQERPRTNVELARVGIRYSARLHDLKRAGYPIMTTPLRDGKGGHLYSLITPKE